MPRDYRACLEDALEAVDKIARYVSGLTRDQFAANEEKVDAVVRNLEVLGEAFKQIPMAICSAHPEIEWKKVAGLRDILIHRYFGVDLDIVWDVISTKLPALRTSLRMILAR
jgi:uncharacterized protein with HEPN domain